MRLFVLVLMLVLLPLRGWMGDAMATVMAAGATNMVADGAHQQSGEGGSGPSAAGATAGAKTDCAGHTAMHLSDAYSADKATSEPSDPTDQNGHGEHCQTCQACHSVAMSTSALIVSSSFSAPSQPQALTAPYTSAVAALSQKPPIS